MALDMTLSMSQLKTQNCGIPIPYKGHNNGLYSSSICHFCSPIEFVGHYMALAKGKLSKTQIFGLFVTQSHSMASEVGLLLCVCFIYLFNFFNRVWNNLRF